MTNERVIEIVVIRGDPLGFGIGANLGIWMMFLDSSFPFLIGSGLAGEQRNTIKSDCRLVVL